MANLQVNKTNVSKTQQTVSTFENGIWFEDRYGYVDRCFYAEMGCTEQQFADATPEQRAAFINVAYEGSIVIFET